MDKITYIIPIWKKDENFEAYLKECLGSIVEQNREEDKVIFVGSKELLDAVSTVKEGIPLKNTTDVVCESTDFHELVNTGVMYCMTKYFMVVEYYDKLTPNAINVASRFVKNKRDVSVLMPVIEITDKNGRARLFNNEMAWCPVYVEGDVLGEVSTELLLAYKDFKTSGALIKTEDFIALKSLKTHFKIATWYEFLLRCTKHDKKVFVYPKVTYVHRDIGDQTYEGEMSVKISNEEGLWLIENATKDSDNLEGGEMTPFETPEVSDAD